MSLKVKTEYGSIEILDSTVANVIGIFVTETYGVVGMASRHYFKDNLTMLMGSKNYSKGVVVFVSDDSIEIELHVILASGVNVLETSKNIQEKLKYNVTKTLGLKIKSVNVFVEDIKEIN